MSAREVGHGHHRELRSKRRDHDGRRRDARAAGGRRDRRRSCSRTGLCQPLRSNSRSASAPPSAKRSGPFTSPVSDEALAARPSRSSRGRSSTTALQIKDERPSATPRVHTVKTETQSRGRRRGQADDQRARWQGGTKPRSASSTSSGHAVTRCRRASGSTVNNLDEVWQITIETRRAATCARLGAGHPRRDPGGRSSLPSRLGTKYDEKKLDTLLGDKQRSTMDYNFPPFSTGDLSRCCAGTVGRQEVSRRLPCRALGSISIDTPICMKTSRTRFASCRTSSRATARRRWHRTGSRRLSASVADGCRRADQGAGRGNVAMGLMKEGDGYVILSDILGDEDHLGDMDFKGHGHAPRCCAPLQMDIKVDGLTRKILEEALEQAKRGRVHILEKMDNAISACSRRGLDLRAAHRHRDGEAGQGPATSHRTRWQEPIRAILEEQTGAQIDINDNGVVSMLHRLDAMAIELSAGALDLGPHGWSRRVRALLQRHRQEDRLRDRRVPSRSSGRAPTASTSW